MLTRIGQIAVTARDVPRAIAFYRDVLGMKLLFEAGGMAFFDCGGVRLMLSTPQGEGMDHPASVIYYKVDGIEKAHQELAARGASFLTPPHRVARLPDHDLWMAFLKDSEGNVLALMSEVKAG